MKDGPATRNETHPARLAVEQKQARVGSATIFYEVAGNGKPLVLLHGLSGSTRWWRYNIEALARHYRVYNVDLVGFGRGRGQPFVLPETASLIKNWLDALAIEQTSIIGHSMGGYVTIEMAANFPRRFDRLVLVDALAVPIGVSYIQHSFHLLNAMRYMRINFLPVLVGDALRAGPLTLWKAIREVVTADIQDELTRIKAPTLILWGKHDTVIPVALGKKLHAYLPDADFVVIKGAGHNPMWDRPQAFNQAVLRFLAGESAVEEAARRPGGEQGKMYEI